MRLAHIVRVTPHRAGLYETTRDLAYAERELGHEAVLVPPKEYPTKYTQDRGVPVRDEGWALRADVIVNHSGLSGALLGSGIPIVHILHGRPHNSYRLEAKGELNVYSYLLKIAKDDRYKAFVTFWREFIPHFENLGIPAQYVPAPVDLNQFKPDGPRGYSFHGHKAESNVVITDLWRDDSDPFHVIHGFLHLARRNGHDVKLHVYAAPTNSAFDVLRKVGGEFLGEVVGFVKGLDHVFRAADCLITHQSIATRSVREALASDCNVVMAPHSPSLTPFQADPADYDAYAREIGRALDGRGPNRETAARKFDAVKSAREFLKIVEGAL